MEEKKMDVEKSKKTKALLYWYIFGVPVCLLFFAYVLTITNVPVLIGFSFLLIVMYAGIISILTIFTNASIAAITHKKMNKNE